MKFTVTLITLLSITSSWTVLAKRVNDQDKREAPSSSGHSSSSYQAPSSYQSSTNYQAQPSHGDASTISIGAGYSIGGAKPSYSFGGQESALQFQSQGPLQLAPITLQPGHGLVGTDLSQIMSQLQHSLNSGALSLQPSSTVAEFHEGQGGQAGQELSYGQFNYGSPHLQQYVLAGSAGSAPSYSAGTKGLSSYSSTGPVLFKPSSEAQGSPAGQSYAPSAGHAFGDSNSLGGHSFAGLSLGAPGHSAGLTYGGVGQSLGGQGHSLGALSFGGAGGHSLSGAGLSLGGAGGHLLGGAGGHPLGGLTFGSSGGNPFEGQGYSFGSSLGSSGLSHGSGSSGHGSGPSLGGAGNSLGAFYKVSSGNHGSHGKSAFKPSTFLGASIQSDSGHSSLSSPHSVPSYGGLSGGGHGLSFGGAYGSFGGQSKSISPLYTKSEGHGSSFDSAAAYSTAGQSASPPGTTYGFPTASYPASSIQSASSAGPQYYVSSSKFPSFGEGSFSYKSPGSSHSSLNSYSSGPKYSFGGHGSSGSRYASSPKDSHGAYSETSYNTIKYSEELKPRA